MEREILEILKEMSVILVKLSGSPLGDEGSYRDSANLSAKIKSMLSNLKTKEDEK